MKNESYLVLGDIDREFLKSLKKNVNIFFQENISLKKDDVLDFFKNSNKIEFFNIDDEKSLENLIFKNLFSKLDIIRSKCDIDEFERTKNLIIRLKNHIDHTCSSYADLGGLFFTNIYNNIKNISSYFSYDLLKDRYKNVPAIIVGSGPSLKEDLSYLKGGFKKALIFASGSIVSALLDKKVDFHFYTQIDPKANFSFDFKKVQEKIGFFQLQTFYKNLFVNQKKVILPCSQIFALENFLHKKLNISNAVFNPGYNVVTTQLDILKHLGCSPILLVGVDLCFDKQEYINKITESNSQLLQYEMNGRIIYTQKDFLLAKKHIEEFLKKNQDIKIYNLSKKSILEGIEKISFHDFTKNLKEIIFEDNFNDLLRDIKKDNVKDLLENVFLELKILKNEIDKVLNNLKNSIIDMEIKNIKNSFLYEIFLKPFWAVLKNVILKNISDDPIHIYINELIFYKNLIDLHLKLIC